VFRALNAVETVLAAAVVVAVAGGSSAVCAVVAPASSPAALSSWPTPTDRAATTRREIFRHGDRTTLVLSPRDAVTRV
jgi:hypothetical protein